MEHHAAGLGRLVCRSKPEGFAAALRADFRTAPLSPRERAILDYAAKLTRTPQDMRAADLAPLRAAGLGDKDILDANLVTAYFAYVNRIADGLGVALDGYVSDDDPVTT